VRSGRGDNAASSRVIAHANLRALDDDFFDFVLAVNLRGPFATVCVCQPMLDASGDGLVVDDGSVSGASTTGPVFQVPMMAAKSTVQCLKLG
jgi:3-oxoacyl-[acyl-carrier protein] reductase